MGHFVGHPLILKEILRLSLEIAIARDELKEAILTGVPLGLCQEQCQTIAVCMLQRSALMEGRFGDLPYNIKILYRK